MSETPDLQALARRYLDLWQDQMTALAADPSLAEALARTVTLMGTGAAAFAGAASGMGGMGASTPTDAVRQPAGSDGAAAPGASATAA
ncbi:MAG: hypothetical protein K2Q10_05795, partial [Rhodospirillales bacterium]|nr:hypothetical protein [Rhodospirillales bacterium]